MWWQWEHKLEIWPNLLEWWCYMMWVDDEELVNLNKLSYTDYAYEYILPAMCTNDK